MSSSIPSEYSYRAIVSGVLIATTSPLLMLPASVSGAPNDILYCAVSNHYLQMDGVNDGEPVLINSSVGYNLSTQTVTWANHDIYVVVSGDASGLVVGDEIYFCNSEGSAGPETPAISSYGESKTYVVDTVPDKLVCEASVSDGGTLSYTWYNDSGTAVSYSASFYPPTNEIGTKYYYCVVTNTLDGQTASATSGTVAITVVSDDSGGGDDGGNTGGGDDGGDDSGDDGGGDDTGGDDTGDDEETVTAEELQAAFMSGLAAGLALYSLITVTTKAATGNGASSTSETVQSVQEAFMSGLAAGMALYSRQPPA